MAYPGSVHSLRAIPFSHLAENVSGKMKFHEKRIIIPVLLLFFSIPLHAHDAGSFITAFSIFGLVLYFIISIITSFIISIAVFNPSLKFPKKLLISFICASIVPVGFSALLYALSELFKIAALFYLFLLSPIIFPFCIYISYKKIKKV